MAHRSIAADTNNVIPFGQFLDQVAINGEKQAYRLLDLGSSDCSVVSKVTPVSSTGFSSITAFYTLGALRMASCSLSATLGRGNKADRGFVA